MAGSGTAHLTANGDATLRVRHLVVEYPLSKKHAVHAVSDVSLELSSGETLGLVGESGCGKSTTGRAVAMHERPTSGEIIFGGRDLVALPSGERRKLRPKLQMIFQDPVSSLNPRRRVRDAVAEGLDIWGIKRGDRVEEAMQSVGLDPAVHGDRRPHELSGGQAQRVCIARALVFGPEVMVCDEIVSALDVSVQAQILNLIHDLKRERALTLLFISHDLAVIKNMSDRIAVMYLGKLCEIGDTTTVFDRPKHPYTAGLIEAIPNPDPTVPRRPYEVRGDPPSPVDPPSGCRFRTRCPRAEQRCAVEEPEIRSLDGRYVACHFPLS